MGCGSQVPPEHGRLPVVSEPESLRRENHPVVESHSFLRSVAAAQQSVGEHRRRNANDDRSPKGAKSAGSAPDAVVYRLTDHACCR